MKYVLFALLSGSALVISSCEKKSYCASCLSENSEGITQDFEQSCSEDQSYTDGFVAGFKESSEDQGFTAVCSKYVTK